MYKGYNLACIIIDLNNSVKPKSIHNRSRHGKSYRETFTE